MRTATSIDQSRRELAERVTGDLEVTLYWSPRDNGISVEVYQPLTDETIRFRVEPDRALDAFHHPFAHLADKTKASADLGTGRDRTATALPGWHMN